MEATTTTNTKGGTKYLVELALMIAIIFVMAFTPLGYLRTPGLSITFLTVPVAVAAMILGPKGGAICGAALVSQVCCSALEPAHLGQCFLESIHSVPYLHVSFQESWKVCSAV